MKRCRRCGVEKSDGEFGLRARNSDGLQEWCKACHSEDGKVRYARHRLLVLEAIAAKQKGRQMQMMVGVTRARQILKDDSIQNAKALGEFLLKHGVKPIGTDSRGNTLWGQDDIAAVAEKIVQKKAAQPVAAEPANADDFSRRQFAVIAQEISALAQGVDLLKRQGQAIMEELSKTQPVVSFPDGAKEAIIEELAGFIGSYMTDQQRALTTQVDSALNDLDANVTKIMSTIGGQNKAIGETKAKVDEVMRVSNSTLSNFYTTQQATRTEILKGLKRVESSVDEMAKEVSRQ